MIIPYFEGWTFHSENIFMFTSILPPNLTHWSPFLGWAFFLRTETRHKIWIWPSGSPRTCYKLWPAPSAWAATSFKPSMGCWNMSSNMSTMMILKFNSPGLSCGSAGSEELHSFYGHPRSAMIAISWDWKHATLICSTFSGVYYVPSGNLT